MRLAGKRALAKLNAFDLVVTVALGSVLASVAVSPDVTLTGGAVTFGLLVRLQYVIASLSARLPSFQRLVKARPTLLARDGALLEDAMERERVTRAEVLRVLRREGLATAEEAAGVVLEADGTLSVVKDRPAAGRVSTLEDVTGWSR